MSKVRFELRATVVGDDGYETLLEPVMLLRSEVASFAGNSPYADLTVSLERLLAAADAATTA